jgi:shikimate dehydrogenase
MMQLGLIGYPLGHSLSPKIHTAALNACGIQGKYSLFPIKPDDQQGLKDLLNRVHNGEITGLNVTIPHKQNVIPLLDDLKQTAEDVGAVNTIWMRKGNLTGDNTDVPGFLADVKKFLDDRESEIVNRKGALVLGAGGSARAVVYALVNDGWDVTIAARRLTQAQELVSQFPIPKSRISSLEYNSTALDSLSPSLSLIVNTTPLGMSPNIDTSPWPANLPFPPNAAIYDLVYNPRETKLVRDARAVDVPATTSLGMLIEQAALAFEIWTACSPPRENLWNALNTEN